MFLSPLNESPVLKVTKAVAVGTAIVTKKVIQSDALQNEFRDLKSLRVKLVVFIAVIWLYVIMNIPKTELKDILWHVTFLFSIMVIVYVLGKQSFKLKLGPIEFILGNGKEEDKPVVNNASTQPQQPQIVDASKTPGNMPDIPSEVKK
jgi:membrane protein required for beta-lactamase induction